MVDTYFIAEYNTEMKGLSAAYRQFEKLERDTRLLDQAARHLKEYSTKSSSKAPTET
ncbi:MAG: hypothetical protein NTX81_02030 [Candidatus Bathyarchaeota archaeon]|nr:hypothetical protein [Candidatus Bathyarchaeota archaeon]